MNKVVNKEVSVIIPCYNINGYIDKCMDSVLSQRNVKKYEIICINDASTDGTAGKLKRYANKYPKVVKCIDNRSNMGVSAARNNGIINASGKGIMFLDGDDTIGGSNLSGKIDTHYIEQFTETLFSNNLNGMAVGNILVTGLTDNQVLFNKRFNKLFKDSYKNIIDHNMAIDFLDWRISSCAVLYRKDVIDKYKVRFLPELMYFEDAQFITSYAFASMNEYKRILVPVKENSFYMYRRRPDSAMTKLFAHSEKHMRRMERTKNKMFYYSWMLLHCRSYFGENSHIYNILGHRFIRTLKQIKEYSQKSDKYLYEVLANYLPHGCIGCILNRCDTCNNKSNLLKSAELCKLKLTNPSRNR